MKKDLISILITNYNKDRYLKKCLNYCLNQSYKNKEILLFDDLSEDKSHEVLKNFRKKKNISIIYNKKKKFESGPLNQIYGIKDLFLRSKGKFIFLLDSDDFFTKKKVNTILKLFYKNNKLNFVQDTPIINNPNMSKIKIKSKNHNVSIWPSYYPTSCTVMKRNFFINFLKFAKSKKYPHLEIDARLCIYAFLKKEFNIINKTLTVYNYDQFGITSNYKKFSKNWWKKRNEGYDYMKNLMHKMKINFVPGIDFYVTKILNIFI